MSSLRSRVIKLAHTQPDLRSHLLPILAQKGAGKQWSEAEIKEKLQEFPRSPFGNVRKIQREEWGWSLILEKGRAEGSYPDDEDGQQWDEMYAQPLVGWAGTWLDKMFGQGFMVPSVMEDGRLAVSPDPVKGRYLGMTHRPSRHWMT